MIELTKSGVKREKAYRIVQKHSKKSYTKDIDLINLIDLIKNDKFITSKISLKKIDKIFNYSKHFKHVNYIYKRVFK